MKVEQMEMGGVLKNFSYLIICEKTGKAALLDPGLAGPGRWLKFRKIWIAISGRGLELVYIINSHRHFDHIMGNKYFHKKTGAQVVSHGTGLRQDQIIEYGEVKLKVIETPGHTADGICLYSDKNIFTGDTLFVGDSGATVSNDSDRSELGASLRKLIETCPPDTVVWPGHDLGTTKTTTLKREQRENVNSEEYGLKSVKFDSKQSFYTAPANEPAT